MPWIELSANRAWNGRRRDETTEESWTEVFLARLKHMDIVDLDRYLA